MKPPLWSGADADAGLRINLTLSSRQHPALTEELSALPKGPPRTARLVVLATLGLVVERGRLPGLPPAPQPSPGARAAPTRGPHGEAHGGAYVARLGAAALRDLIPTPGADGDGSG